MATLKEEVMKLTVRLQESDSNKEILLREIRTSKDEENDKIGLVRREKENQQAYFKGEIEWVKAEKDESERKIWDLIKQQAEIEGWYKEEHHKTVVYFEEKVQALRA